MERLSEAGRFVLTITRLADEHDIKYPAAALAYYSFVSFLPLFTLVVAVLGESMSGRIGRASPTVFTPEAQQLVTDSISSAAGRDSAVVLAIVVLGWSVANVALDLQTAIERVEGRTEAPVKIQLTDAVKILGSFGLLVVAVVLVGLVSVVIPSPLRVAQGWPVGLFVVLTVSLVPLYSLPSRVVDSVATALPGAVTAALGLTALLTGISVYAVNASQYAIYGVLSGIIIVLTSLYLAAFVLMIGFVVNVAAHGWDGTAP
jgi:membrane protein